MKMEAGFALSFFFHAYPCLGACFWRNYQTQVTHSRDNTIIHHVAVFQRVEMRDSAQPKYSGHVTTAAPTQ
jgi:hypothetical protein